MSAEREEYLRLKAAQNVHEMSPERREYLRLKAGQEPEITTPDTLASMRFEPEAAPAVSTMVSPEIGQVGEPHFGILPKGTGEKFEKALPQWSVTEDMGVGQKALRTAGNLALGAAKFPVRMGTGILEEPMRVPQALAEFVPTVAKRVSDAAGGLGLTGKYGMLRPDEEQIGQARRELMEEPFDVALLAAPALKGLRAPRVKPKPKPVIKPVVEAVKAKKVVPRVPVEQIYKDVGFATEKKQVGTVSDFLLTSEAKKQFGDIGGVPVYVVPGLVNKVPGQARVWLPKSKDVSQIYIEVDPVTATGTVGQLVGEITHEATHIKRLLRGRGFTDRGVSEPPALKAGRHFREEAEQLLQGEKGKVVGKKEVLGEQPIKEQPKIIGLNKAEVARIRRHTELDKLPDAQKRTFVETLERAKADKLDESALETADHVLKAKKQITDAEHAGMVIRAAKLADEYDAVVKNASSYLESGNKAAAQMERSRAEAVIDQLDKLTEATKFGRREVARALSIGRMMINRESYDLAHVVQRARVAKGGKLTPKETAKIEGLVAEHAKLEKRIADLERRGATLPEIDRVRIHLEMQKKKIRGRIERFVPWTPRSVFGETVNTLRTLKATADMSGILRQGLVPIVMSWKQPKVVPKSFAKAFVSFFSKNKAEQIDYAIRRMDQHYLREKSGLHLSEFGVGARLAKREEYFMAQVIERVPGIGHIVQASNRNMATFLNLMRTSLFDQYVIKYPNAPQASLTRWANLVNVASGRGNLGRWKAVGNELSIGVFAPRFAVSRPQTPYLMLKYLKDPHLRKEIAQDMVALISLGTTTLALAKLAGLEVGYDPREADFGKIRVGNTRIDLWGGYQQPARLVARLGIAAGDRIGVSGKKLAESEKDFNPIDAVGRFAAYKLAPAITVPTELMTGESIVGEPRTPLTTSAHAVMPMVYEDIMDAYREGGYPRAGISAGLSFFGVSVNTYGDSQSRVRRDIKSAMRKGDYTEARTRAYQWNMEHPDRRIHSVRTITDTLNIVTGSRSRTRQRAGARR